MIKKNLEPIYEPVNRKLRVAGFMSGTGTVLKKIIEEEDGYKVVIIFSDKWNSNANKIGKDYDIPVVTRDLESYCNSRNVSKYNMESRKFFDKETSKIMNYYNVSVIAFAGYMSIVTESLISNFICLNVHPADLTILNKKGERKYIGSTAVKDAMLAGETHLKSTIHLLTEKIDGGPILIVSKPMEVEKQLKQLSIQISQETIYNYIQYKLKQQGDCIIFPMTLKYLAEGRFMKDSKNNIYFDNKLLENGIQL